MSQATLTPDLLNLPTAQASLALSGFPKYFEVRSSLFTLIATGAIVIAGAAGIARLSDSVVETNERSAAAINAVPPPIYYQFLAQNHETAADTATDTPAPTATADTTVAAPAASAAN